MLVQRARRLVRRPARFGRAAVRYVRHRLALPARYEERSLDDLLSELAGPRPEGRLLSLRELELAMRCAEPFAARIAPDPNTCLFRALARFAVLAEHGHEPAFVLGIAEDAALPGHAWVEVEDRAFLEPAPPRFVTAFRKRAFA